MVLVKLIAGGRTGLGYTYAHKGAGALADSLIWERVLGQNVFSSAKIWGELVQGIRNQGRWGLAAMAVSAIDIALWDLKSKMIGLPLSVFLGRLRNEVELYGSGGFLTYSGRELSEQISYWKSLGIKKIKIKIGVDPFTALERVDLVLKLIDNETELFVDANEAFDRVAARWLVEELVSRGVSWFEQPISVEDTSGMCDLREKASGRLAITTGEYLSDPADFLKALESGEGDYLQPDVTRCQGLSGFLRAAHLCEAFHVPISSHCAPALHGGFGFSIPGLKHIEYFFDHERIESTIFETANRVRSGHIIPSDSAHGLGIELRERDAERFAA